jgi:hypothetical protein
MLRMREETMKLQMRMQDTLHLVCDTAHTVLSFVREVIPPDERLMHLILREKKGKV